MKAALPWLCVVAWAIGAVAARTYGVWIALGATGLVLGAVCLVLDGRTLLARLRQPRDVPWGLIAGLVMALATYAIYPPLARDWPAFFADANALYGAFVALPSCGAAAILVPIIASEELVWRGVVQGALSRRFTPMGAALVAAVIYALAHAPTGSPALTIAALGCGLVWSGLRAWTGGLLAPFVSHVIWDFLVLLLHPVVPKPL